MLTKIGKIKKYQKGVGEIITEDDKYLFTEDDLDNNEKYKIKDLVIFSGEKIHDTNRAFYVKKLKK